MGNGNKIVSPHVLIFPLPIQAPVRCMLHLAQLLCLDEAFIKVTFLTIPYIKQRLFSCNEIQTYFEKYPNFRFETIPDGLPEDNPRTVDRFAELMQSMESAAAPGFEEIITSSENPVSCVITEGFFNFPTKLANKNGVPLLCFDTFSPCAIWTDLCLPELVKAGELPFKDDKLDEIIRNAPPGMEGVLRRRDLPSFCRSSHDVFGSPEGQLILNEINNIPQAQALILNTFQALDAPILSEISKMSPNIYAIGPLHAHHKARVMPETGAINSSNLWEEDRSCITWLDEQLPNSVLYVSIGSLSVMTKDQFFEFWHGLVNSGSRFLWVQRPGSVIGLDSEPDQVPLELSKGTKERGYIVSWAPQEEVLAHPAIGGFLTHSGWCSTLESIVAGKPMICWPYFVDQQVNSRFVGQVWELGLDMKDTCDRVTIEKMIREVMDSRNNEFLKRAQKMAKLAKLSVNRGGSSFTDLDRLIEDIKMMKHL